MADKKISELNDATLPLDGTEQIPIVQGGETKKVSADDLGGGDSLWEVSTGANSLIPKDSNNVASGDNSIAEGFMTKAKAPFSRAGGRSTTVETSAEGGVAEGEDTITRGKGAYTNGIETEANGDASFSVGDNTIAQSYGEVAVGTYNALDVNFDATGVNPFDKAYSVGVGTFVNRKDGFVVRKNGVVTAPEQSISEYDADTSGKIIVTKEILNNELPNTDDFVEKSGDTMTGFLQTPIVQEKTLIQTGGLFGNLNVDWTLFSNFDFTLTENSVITQTGVPESGYNATITIYVKGDYALTLPTEWIVIGGTYDTNGTQFIVQSWDDGNFYCAIGGGEIDLSNYLQKSGGDINGNLNVSGNVGIGTTNPTS